MPESKNIFWQESIAHQWGLYAPPVRPSASEIRIWRHWLKRKKNARTLILGATPELRHLCHALGHNVTLIDVSLPMMSAMQRFMRVRDPQETWVRANWTDNPLRSDYFDFVIGDLVVGNVPRILQSAFFASIARVLKVGGLFIHRPWLGAPMDMQTLQRQFGALRLPLPRQRDNEWCFGLLGLSWDPKSYEVSSEGSRRIIQQYLASLSLSERSTIAPAFRRFNILFMGKKKWWVLPSDALRRAEQRFFRIVDILEGDDRLFVARTPLHILKKKN